MKKIIRKIRENYIKFFAPKRISTYQQSAFYTKIWAGKRILLYTDSRGINIPKHFDYLHFSTRFLRRYNVDAYLCPEKWTTIPDFLKLWKSAKSVCYDHVILYAGAVDAAPRHQKILINEIYPCKKDIFNELFGARNIWDYIRTDFNCDYEGDKTINMYSLEMAQKQLIPRLLEIPQLIWIGANKIDPTWRGNYWKDRPKNIRLIEEYSNLFADSLPHVVDLLDLWSLDDVRTHTFDNIHPNKLGSDFIYDALERLLNMID